LISSTVFVTASSSSEAASAKTRASSRWGLREGRIGGRVTWLEDHFVGIVKIVLLKHLFKALLIKFMIEQILVLIEDVLVHELLSLELLQTLLDIALIDLTFIENSGM